MDVVVEDIDGADPIASRANPNPVEHLAIAERFNISTPTKEEDEKLATIWGYVKSKGGERGISDVIWDVINMEQTLGSPRLGETRIDKLYKYVKLRIDEARIQGLLKDVSAPAHIH